LAPFSDNLGSRAGVARLGDCEAQISFEFDIFALLI
jgi:hypothetical protein